MKLVVVRQLPGIGDALLLGPLIWALRNRYPTSELTVITDPTYFTGALPTIFRGIPGVNRVEHIPIQEWTTAGVKALSGPAWATTNNAPPPPTIQRADKVFDCNTAFLDFEREHKGYPPYGIAEFWLRHFDLYTPGMDLRPKYDVAPAIQDEVTAWMGAWRKPLLGIVMNAGHPARDWDHNDFIPSIAAWAQMRSLVPILIHPFKSVDVPFAHMCVGKPLDFVAGVLQRCKAVLTPDTGLLHLAEAVGTKTVALWGIMDPVLRIQNYDTVTVPLKSLGFCAKNTSTCQCSWKAQQWSCLRRLTLPMIFGGLEEAGL